MALWRGIDYQKAKRRAISFENFLPPYFLSTPPCRSLFHGMSGLIWYRGFIIDDKIRDQACCHVHELCICSLWPSKFAPLQCRSRTWRKKKIIGGSCRGKGVILSNCYCQSIGIAGAASPCLYLFLSSNAASSTNPASRCWPNLLQRPLRERERSYSLRKEGPAAVSIAIVIVFVDNQCADE